ncbi:hypothetical protein [uncultured Tateyamaria sp.]|uniref:hypothetical protein n=1 Tax=uncultured Tateyamaria sp. TaxID=455651 RepID=UPI0026239B99|nr:hypothetical protein [uncultured Tateyamaria sp.]
MSTAEFSHDTATLGGRLTVEPDKKAPVFPNDKTTGAVSARVTLGTDPGATTVTSSQFETLVQDGAGLPNLSLPRDDDPLAVLDGSFGDVSIQGTISQQGSKSFEVGVDAVAYDRGDATDNETFDLTISDDTAPFAINGVSGVLTVDPLLLDAEYNLNAGRVIADAVGEIPFDLDNAIRLSIFERAGISPDLAVNASDAVGFVITG